MYLIYKKSLPGLTISRTAVAGGLPKRAFVDMLRFKGLQVRENASVEEGHRIFSLLVDNVKEVFWIYSFHENRYTYISPSVEKLRGISVEEAMKESFADSLSPESFRYIADNLPLRIRGYEAGDEALQTLSTEVQQPCKNGDWVWVEITSTLHKNAYGKVHEVIGVSRDITQRKTDNAVLSHTRANFRAIFEKSGTAIVLVEDNGQIINVNPAFCQMTGYPKDYILQKNFYDFLVAGDEPCVAEVFAKALHEEAHQEQSEIRLVNIRGEILWGLINISGLGRSLGASQQLILQIQETTAQKNAQDALRESEERLRTIFNASRNVAFIIFEPKRNGRIIDFSHGAEMIFGYERQEILGKRIRLISGDPGRNLFRAFWRKITQTKGEVTGEQLFFRKDNSVFSGLYTIYPIYDSLGNLKAFLSVVVDISKVKQAEKIIQTLNLDLQFKNRELEQLLYVTSHDLRSPLVNIRGFSKELQNGVHDLQRLVSQADHDHLTQKVQLIFEQDIRLSLDYILRSIEKMDKLLYGLLQFSRLGKHLSLPSKVDMNKLIRDVLQNFEYVIKEAGVTVCVGELPSCFAREDMINQAFSNLVGNAIKYMDGTREGRIVIEGWLEDGMAVFGIKDNGIGIDERHLNKIFELFYRLYPEKGEGEGLGLSIVKKILDLNHGKVKVESVYGQGTHFMIYLPQEQTKTGV